jgi:hypothetical protein
MNTDDPGNSEGTCPDAAVAALVLESFERVVRRPLVPAGLGGSEAVRWLYEDAPFCVLAHDTAADPSFIYANRAAQRCFEYPWTEFAGLPSRLSAEAPSRAERQAFLDTVARDGFTEGYKGLRVSRSGRRFFIKDATVWQLIDGWGVLRGQGALVPAWQDEQADLAESGGRHAD